MYHVICQIPVWFQVDLLILQQETEILELKKIFNLMPKFISIPLFQNLYPNGEFILLLHSHY